MTSYHVKIFSRTLILFDVMCRRKYNFTSINIVKMVLNILKYILKITLTLLTSEVSSNTKFFSKML